jgi:hypothetical protein
MAFFHVADRVACREPQRGQNGGAVRTSRLTWPVTVSAAAAIALTAALALPAQAAGSTGWRLVFRHHYGAASTDSDFQAVVAASRADAWAFGEQGANGDAATGTPVAARWTGSRWRAAALPAGMAGTIEWASGSSPRNVWAVVGFGEDVLKYNGSSWSIMKRFPVSSEVTGVTAISDTDVWLFGGGGFEGGVGTWHYNGHSWVHLGGAALGLESASAVSARNIWAIGSAQTPEDAIDHYTSGHWHQVSAAALAGGQFFTIAALSATNVWVSGMLPSGHETLFHYDGTSWSRVAPRWQMTLLRIIPDGQGGIWLSGVSGSPAVNWVLHRSGSGSWTRIRIGTGGTGIGGLALIPGGTAVWGAGASATKSATDAAVYAYGLIG